MDGNAPQYLSLNIVLRRIINSNAMCFFLYEMMFNLTSVLGGWGDVIKRFIVYINHIQQQQAQGTWARALRIIGRCEMIRHTLGMTTNDSDGYYYNYAIIDMGNL